MTKYLTLCQNLSNYTGDYMHYNVLFWIIIAIVIVSFAWDQILTALNRSRMSDTLPPELAGIYEPQEYARQQQYQRANSRFATLSSTFTTVLMLVVLMIGAAGWLYGRLQHLTTHYLLLPLLFFGIIFLVITLLDMPFDYYDTFTIEERFGFNKSSRGLFFADALKGLLLTALLGGVVVAAVAFFYHLTTTWFWLIAWGVLTLFSVGVNYFYSQLIVPLFNKQTPLEEGELRDALMALGERAGFTISNIYVLDSSKRSTKSNAYFTGFGKRKRIVLYDTLLDDLEIAEIVAVLAHEIGHYRKHHTLIGLVLGVVMTGIQLWLMSFFLGSPAAALAMGSPAAAPSFALGLIAFSLVFTPVSELLSVGQSVLSRRHEYQADAFAAQMGLADPLISGLKKISAKALSNLTPHPLVVFWEYSHPTLLQRMEQLAHV
ncbi:MAG: M48 family metallopeptidase [Coriobacteriia bacterium]|nr:M48 family metallopeptidase [Coriobacteriia bacterium]